MDGQDASQEDEAVDAAERLSSEVKAMFAELREAQGQVNDFQKLMERSTKLQDEVKRISMRSERELASLGKQVALLPDGEVKTRLQKALKALWKRQIGLRKVRPETRSFFSRIILGRVNVKCFSDRERERLRDEYNKFKLRTNVIFILFPLVVLFFHYYLRHEWLDTHWINIFHHLWLLYYFVSLALRENILLVNGSNIRPWWIYHHYISAAGVVVWLVWPLTDIYLSYVPYVTLLSFYTGLVQSLQILFYRKRDYANRALGKSGPMDVSYPETLTELPKELLILVPFLFVAQLWQVALGLSFFRTLATECNIFSKHWTEYKEELQVFASGVFSVVLGMGNFISTILTVYSKARSKRFKLQNEEEEEELKILLGDHHHHVKND